MKNPTENSQKYATWIASIVAVLALVVSLFSLYESHETRIAVIRDNVTVLVSRYIGDYPLDILSSDERINIGAVGALWEILVSNTGSGTVSLTGYEIFQIVGEKGEIQYYSGIDKGMFSSENLAPVNLPIALETGKSIRLLLKIGISPGKNAHKILCSTSRGKKVLSLKMVEKLLAANEIDIYDNKVVPFLEQGKVIGWRVETMDNQQNFLLKLHTARGTEIRNITRWYDMKKVQ